MSKAAAAVGAGGADAASSSRNDDSDSDSDDPTVLQYKVILLGDGSVGKTSIANRFSSDHFAQTYKQTVGLDFFLKQIELPGNHMATLQLWDIGGQSINSKMITNYIFGADAVLLCYDTTNYQSFQNVQDWLALVQVANRQPGGKVPLIALVSNKNDLPHLRVVGTDKQTAFLSANKGLLSFNVSAKTGDGINGMFLQVAGRLSGVEVKRQDVALAANIVSAEVVKHRANDPENVTEAERKALKPEKKRCAVM